ncbi:hypothetical protein BU24DRAFT_38761 [Aaosphaeria arxii CBS 175.79]|uniref:Vacuolar protein sorting-associated protein 62 n=1 Tax=Aaosphaeria arxii CBS 175.79 TaxID=1450172 RepID=A0A6A5Y987_9PLEO|nr:uncharacterized protein BU24DRAFT_38761 [Aaosphaeria arxii CBS 175.79]KAF2022145.1 hypothetical protein BU24DRAFT_38761 [Aaosphaeria arxii CBS 175.79]
MLLHDFFSFAALLATVSALPTIKMEKRQAPAGVPDYVMKYAPVVYLHSQEKYFPSDISAQLAHSIPKVQFQDVPGVPNPLDLNNLDQVTGDAFLTSKDDVTKDPEWIKGVRPDSNGKTNNAVTAAVIVNDKGDGNVDAFYFHFYAYNYGGTVLGLPQLNFGNHVGDWEHNMIRFKNGVPQHVWYSQHANGQAFSYSVTQKHNNGDRPIAYSASGSHAIYAIPGKHDHTIPNFNLPGGVLEDKTDAGVFWDPMLAAYYYKFNAADGSFTPYDGNSGTPVKYLGFKGRWGDQEYPTSDKRQVKLFGQAKFSSGPTGPADKQLNRQNVCPENGQRCILRGILVPRTVGDEEDEGA